MSTDSTSSIIIDETKLNWASKKLNYQELWKHTQGSDIKIGLIDSGINHNYELIDTIISEYNLIDNSDNAPDDLNHGTHISGILCGHGSKLIGICPESKIEIYKVISKTNYLNSDILLSALNKAILAGCHIISMSLEFYNFSQNIQDLINQNKTNCIFIAAAGNKGKLNRIKDCYPASYENCISVGAVDENNKRYYRSNMSNHINVAAPGTNINSCISKNIYSNESDTSFAVPFVTGLAALLTSYQIKNNQLNLTIIKDAIINTTTNLGNKTEYGSGLINPSESFNYLKSHL